MDSDANVPPSPQRASAAAFWWRLTDNAFRRWYFFLLPVVVFAGLGVYQSTKTMEIYRSSGVLSATVNPLLPDQAIAGINSQFWETPGDVASRTMNEQLRTDAFIEAIAERAALDDLVQSNQLTLELIRTNIWSTADGSALVKVNATWGDPTTSHALVEGTIVEYQEYLAEAVASDASEAVDFYTNQLDTYEAERVAALGALTEFVDGLPDLGENEDLGFADNLRLTSLRDDLAAAEDKLAATEGEIEKAALQVAQSKSEAGRSLTVIDAPSVPRSPESTLIDRLVTIVSFTVLGLAVVIAALLVSTVLDQSVASARDIEPLKGVTFVATVPVWKNTTPSVRGRTKRQGPSRRAPAAASEAPTERVRAGV